MKSLRTKSVGFFLFLGKFKRPLSLKPDSIRSVCALALGKSAVDWCKKEIAVYLIAYDIANPRRLSRTAKILERNAERCQKSVFLFNGDKERLLLLLDEIVAQLDVTQDLIQAWKLSRSESSTGICRGLKKPAFCQAVFLFDDEITYLD